MFHFDKDRFGWVLVFVYLTDVTMENGPHCFVKKTHKQKPASLWRDGRIADEDVFANVPEEDVTYITGKAGTVFLADTKAFHKGTPVQKDNRIFMSLLHSNSLFGQHYDLPQLSDNVKKHVEEAAHRFGARYMQRYL